MLSLFLLLSLTLNVLMTVGFVDGNRDSPLITTVDARMILISSNMEILNSDQFVLMSYSKVST